MTWPCDDRWRGRGRSLVAQGCRGGMVPQRSHVEVVARSGTFFRLDLGLGRGGGFILPYKRLEDWRWLWLRGHDGTW